MQIALIGCNHRTAPVELRERVSFTPEAARQAALELRQSGLVEEAVIVSTCNRSELYGVPAAGTADAVSEITAFVTRFHGLAPSELNGYFYQHIDRDAVTHLFRVAAGLDSMLLGEAEILGQVRDAYLAAFEHGTTGPLLNRLFQAALEVGKRVRSETEVGARPMSVAFAGVKLAERVFGKLKDHRAVILGAGSVGEQVMDHLRNRGIGGLTVINRTRERAEELARRMEGTAESWDRLEHAITDTDLVVTSVTATEPILHRALVERIMQARHNRLLFLVDLGVPRNIDREVADLYNVYLYGIDDLTDIVEQNRHAREAEIPRAETIISEQVKRFEAWQASMELAGVLKELREQLHGERRALLESQQEALGRVSAEDRERLIQLTELLVERLLAEPSRRLRGTKEIGRRIRDIEALRELFGLDKEKT